MKAIHVFTPIIDCYTGPAVYALIDDCGKKYIGSSLNVYKRMQFYSTQMKAVLIYGVNGYLNSAICEAVLNGHKFKAEILEKFPIGITNQELEEKERFYLAICGGVENTYNVAVPKRVQNKRKKR